MVYIPEAEDIYFAKRGSTLTKYSAIMRMAIIGLLS